MVGIQKRSFSRAFSLIELLVVLGILAILLTIVSPAIVKGIRNAELAVCSSKMQQIGIAGQTFRQEADGRFPSAMMLKVNLYKANTTDWEYYRIWAEIFGNESIMEVMEAGKLSCPTSLRVGEQQGFPPHKGFSLMTYSGNRFMWWSDNFNTNWNQPERYTQISRPARAGLAFCNDGRFWKAADGMFFGNQPTFFHGDDTVANMPNLNFMNGRCNTLFFDGHVKAMRPGWGTDAVNPAVDQIPCERPGQRAAWNQFWLGKGTP